MRLEILSDVSMYYLHHHQNDTEDGSLEKTLMKVSKIHESYSEKYFSQDKKARKKARQEKTPLLINKINSKYSAKEIK